MKQLLLMLSLAVAGLGAKGQNAFQERAYRLDSKFKFMSASDQDRQGNVIMSGLTSTSIHIGNGAYLHNSMIMLIKPNTDTLWTRKASDVPDYYFHAGVKFLANGGYTFGSTYKKSSLPLPADSYDGILQKYNYSGNLLLNHSFDPATDNNTIINFITMPDKGFLISGGGGIIGSPFAFSLTRTDSMANVIWQRNLTRVSPDGLDYMEHAGSGRVILAGNNLGSNPGISKVKVKLFLVDANGDSLRGATLNMTNDLNRSERMYLGGTEHCVVSLADGGFLITGTLDTVNHSAGIGTSLGFVARVNASFQVVWKYYDRTPGLTNVPYFTKAKELKDGSIIVLGQNSQMNSFQLYRFNAFGALINTYPFTSTQYPSIQVNVLEALPDSSFMIGGRCRTAGNAQTGFYVAKVKIPGLAAGRPSYIMAAPKEVNVAANALGAAYPNPASGQVYIPYQLPTGTRTASVRLTDLTGKEVGSYEIKAEKQGTLPVNVSRLSAGLYLYTLVLDGRPVATKKLSVQK